jgi:nuclear transport factor 2 (NTF2) superfamily protein
MTPFIPEELNRYCYWQRERESIRIKKESGDVPGPWTDDKILQDFKFCQVFREDDRTTRWFRSHIRENLRNDEDVLMATIIFRWFNLIETGRTLIENKKQSLQF